VPVCFALVHQANQYLITDGYDNREGISDIVGSETDETGIIAVLAIHESERVPLNLHISGTLLEALRHGSEIVTPIQSDADRGFSAKLKVTPREFELRLRVEANIVLQEVA
jgi:hypothetical protein